MKNYSLSESIKIINEENLKYKSRPIPGCSEEEIALLKQRSIYELGCRPDEGYLSLLRLCNGFGFNGLVIYASKPIVVTSHFTIEGVIDGNLMWRDMDNSFEKKFIFGDVDMDVYAKDISTGKYQVMSKTSDHVFEEFDSFDQMISFGVEKYS